MREAIEERPEHDQAGARPAAPARPQPGQAVGAGAATGRPQRPGHRLRQFWAQGNHGQFIYVSPSRNVVLVRFGTEYNYDHWPEPLAGLARRP